MGLVEDALSLGWQHHRGGNLRQAEACYRQALQIDPHHVDALACLGTLCLRMGNHAEAEHLFERVLRISPGHLEVCNNLGIALVAQRKLEEAVTVLRQATALHPTQADLHGNLGNALRELGKENEAEASLRQALELNPVHVGSLGNLALLLQAQGRWEETVACRRRALTLKPGQAGDHHDLGHLHLQAAIHGPSGVDFRRHLELALACFDRAISLQPDHAEAHKSKGMILLMLGDWETGWPEYEWRWRCRDLRPRGFRQPAWDGSPLEGQTILLHAEQGFGDVIQFIRFAPLVRERGGQVVVECPGPLIPLLRDCAGVDRFIPAGSPLPDFAAHASLMSVPAILKTTASTLPAQVPYLRPDPERAQYWRRELSTREGLSIGIVWQGNPKHHNDRHRSIPLAQFEPLAYVDGVRLFSLQKEHGLDQLSSCRFPVTDVAGRLDESAGAFVETAAVMSGLDLIVTCDTASAHLAGALGLPVWVALPVTADWRWLLDREDSPWYPTMRLFRQDRLNNWEEVFRRMSQSSKLLGGRKR
jgi:Flp pilus assembly protein TadD